jgi:hypothetical protein
MGGVGWSNPRWVGLGPRGINCTPPSCSVTLQRPRGAGASARGWPRRGGTKASTAGPPSWASTPADPALEAAPLWSSNRGDQDKGGCLGGSSFTEL